MILALAYALALLLHPAYEPVRIDAALYVSAVAWGHDPAEFRALAWCESKLEANPRRYGTRERWGHRPVGRPWQICGLLQLHGGKKGKGQVGRLPRCELQILVPALSAWYGAGHLAGWKRACGKARQWDCYNQGGTGLTAGTWGKCVRRRANKMREKAMKKVPTNTTLDARDNPQMVLARAMVFGASGAIEAQEAEGQRQLVESETLPADLRGNEATVRAWGVKFLGVDEHNPLFQHVELPVGWTKRATDHAMWTDLLDAKGRKRASIFYKAAFYDQRANMHIARRFRTEFDWDRRDKADETVSRILDCGKVIAETEPIPLAAGQPGFEAQDKADALAEKWLDEHYPNWRDAGAYWD